VESQIHRELSSGLSMPIGFKNSTTGFIKPAINALICAAIPHHFLGVNIQGKCCIVETKVILNVKRHLGKLGLSLDFKGR
jgi:3-deoxy-7-phosphoheptulonate synthase